MKPTTPAWALRPAGPEDHRAARGAHERGALQIAWPDRTALRSWARQAGWPTPRLGFEAAFIARLLADEASFAQGLTGSGLALQLPRERCTIAPETVADLDALYAQRSADGRPTDWDTLVEELRTMRRAIEAGVVLDIAGEPPLGTWGAFYDWAHGRYHMLEDGADRWIGDDRG
jgi:hypothetical protein